MELIFTPALGERIDIPISDCTDEQDHIAVRFTAALGYQEYLQVIQGALKVQLWSDVASPEADEWNAFNFELESKSEDLEGKGGQEDAVHLANRQSPVKSDASTQHRLVAWVPISIRSARNFSFTYRLRYASGEIRWLGAYGHNGYAVVSRTGLRDLNFAQEWTQPGRVLTLDSPNHPVKIAGFTNFAEYNMWGLPTDMYSMALPPGGSELLVAIPRDLGLYSSNPSYVIQTSSGTTLQVDATGSITAFGTGNVMIHACYDLSRLQKLLALRPLSSGTQVDLRILHGQNDSACLVITSRKSQVPTKIVLVPLVPSGTATTTVNIGVDLLADLLGDATLSRLTVYSPTAADVRILDAPFDQSIPFVVPRHGGEFLVSQAFDFEHSAKDAKASDCQVTLLVPYTGITRAIEDQVSLPTPPPSPEIHQRRPQVTFAAEDVVIPQAQGVKHEESGSSVLRRRWNIRSSSSTDSTQPSTQPEPTTISQRGVILSLFFVWIHYVAILLKAFGIRLNNLNKNTLPVNKESLFNSTGSAAPPEREESPEHTPLAQEEGKEGSSSSTAQEESPKEEMGPESVISAPRPKTGRPPFSSVARASSVPTFFADLLTPSPPPLAQDTETQIKASAVAILSFHQSITPSSDGVASTSNSAVPISSLHKVLTVDGNVPEDLTVTLLEPYRKSEHGEIGKWAHYLVSSSSWSGKAMGKESRLKIAHTA